MISVCIPTFNGEKYIREQVDSILNQLTEDDEIVISDDGSTDSTLLILEQYNDSRIKIIKNKKLTSEKFKTRIEYVLKKVSLNVQNALAHCNGDYIYLADQDDIWIEGRVAKTIGFLKNEEPTLVICDCTIIDESLNVTEESYFNYIRPSQHILRTLAKSSFHGCCMCFNRTLFEKTLPFPDYSIGHDLWIGLTAMKVGKIKFLPESLLFYRRHSSTVTKTGQKSTNSLGFKIRYRLMMIAEYFKMRKEG